MQESIESNKVVRLKMIGYKRRNFRPLIILLSGISLLVISQVKASGADASIPIPDFKEKFDYAALLSSRLEKSKIDNAWENYKVFMDTEDNSTINSLLKPSEKIKEQLQIIVTDPRPWDQNQFSLLADYLADIESLLQAYSEGTDRSHFSVPVEVCSEGVFLSLPKMFGPSKLLSQAMVAKAWQSKEGKFDSNEFVIHIKAVLRHSNHLYNLPILLNQRAANLERSILYLSINKALESNLLDCEDLNQISVLLATEDSINIRERLLPTVALEETMSYSLIQDMCTQSGIFRKAALKKKNVYKWLYTMGHCHEYEASEVASRFIDDDPLVLVGAIRSYFEKIREIIQNQHQENYEKLFKQNAQNYLSNHSYFEYFPPTSYLEIYEENLQIERRRRIVRLGVELKKHYSNKNTFPDELSSLFRDGDVSLTTDPITGSPFVYEKSDTVISVLAPATGRFELIIINLHGSCNLMKEQCVMKGE